MPRKRPSLFMEYTEIAAEKTAAEITSLLIKAGATHVAGRYENRVIVGMEFTLALPGGKHSFTYSLPVRVDPVFQFLEKHRSKQMKATSRAQCERIAWRQLFRWMEAQLGLIEVGMAEASEVFIPYMVDRETGQTFYEAVAKDQFKALGPGSSFPALGAGRVTR